MPQRVAQRMRVKAPHFALFELPFFDPFFFFEGEPGAAELEARPAGSDAASVLILRPVSGFWMLPGFTRS